MIRVVAYNISGGPDPAAVGSVLRTLEPRIVCVLATPGPRRLRRLARAAGLEVAQRAGRRGPGTALLVHPDVHVMSTSAVALTTPRDVPTRAASHAIVGVGALRLSVVAIAFGLRPDVRRTNLDELMAYLGTVDAPSVIGCDLNESIRSPIAQALARTYRDAYAVAGSDHGDTASDPSTRQDVVFVDPGLEILRCHIPSAPPVDSASPHRPVVVDLATRDDRDSWVDDTAEPGASAA